MPVLSRKLAWQSKFVQLEKKKTGFPQVLTRLQSAIPLEADGNEPTHCLKDYRKSKQIVKRKLRWPEAHPERMTVATGKTEKKHRLYDSKVGLLRSPEKGPIDRCSEQGMIAGESLLMLLNRFLINFSRIPISIIGVNQKCFLREALQLDYFKALLLYNVREP